MEEEAVVAADEDTKEILRKALNVVYQLWLEGKILGETLEKANKIKEDQGYHEHEVSCGGEADLHRHYRRCQKNPGHSHFIPIQKFKIEHLPQSHRDKVIFDWIRAHADLTCRLLVMCTSENRPRYHPIRKHLLYPFSKVRGVGFMRTGTGWMGAVYRYKEEDNKPCQCDECTRPGTHTPHKAWGKFNLATATHVVFDDDEARQTTCYFGYEKSTTLLHKCLKLKGLKFEESNVEADNCKLTYITHDMDVVNKLYKMFCNHRDLFKKVTDKYGRNKTTGMSGPGPVVIISHPHGCSKHISVGEWTNRQTWGETFQRRGREWEADVIRTSYTYNTHTCPGSSGAPVIRLPEAGKWWELSTYHYHSEAGEGNTNNNKSVAVFECVSPPTPRTSY